MKIINLGKLYNEKRWADKNQVTYQKNDLDELRGYFLVADDLWYDEWVKQGSKSYGSCCMGKAITINYLRPRCKYPMKLKVVKSPPCQGNVSASDCVSPALEYLRSKGIECEYYDGRMD